MFSGRSKNPINFSIKNASSCHENHNKKASSEITQMQHWKLYHINHSPYNCKFISELGGLVHAFELFEKYYEVPMKNTNGTNWAVTMALYTPVNTNYESYESPILLPINTIQL